MEAVGPRVKTIWDRHHQKLLKLTYCSFSSETIRACQLWDLPILTLEGTSVRPCAFTRQTICKNYTSIISALSVIRLSNFLPALKPGSFAQSNLRRDLLLNRSFRKLCLCRWERAFKRSHVWCNTQASFGTWRAASCEGTSNRAFEPGTLWSNGTSNCASAPGTLWSWWIRM